MELLVMVNTCNLAWVLFTAGKPCCFPSHILANTMAPHPNLQVVRVKKGRKKLLDTDPQNGDHWRRNWEKWILGPATDLLNLNLQEWGLTIWVSLSSLGGSDAHSSLRNTAVEHRGDLLILLPLVVVVWRPECNLCVFFLFETLRDLRNISHWIYTHAQEQVTHLFHRLRHLDGGRNP